MTMSESPQTPQPRQFVSFAFYKLDPAFRRLDTRTKAAARDEFISVFSKKLPGFICLTYSTLAMKADSDLLLWRISYSTDDFQAQAAEMNRTQLGGYLSSSASFLAMTKRSTYIDKMDP